MFKTNTDRLDYSKMLIPPVGYKTVFAVGTTYSLDLETLIGVSIALGLNEDIDSKLLDSPIYMLEALRKVSDKMLVFCEGGQIKAPATQNKLFPLLENSVCMINLKDNHSFHPKFWLVKYESEEEYKYRLIVLSRNLTFDRSWDVAVSLDGKIGRRKIDKNKPIIDFLNFLYTNTDAKSTKILLKKKIFKKFVDEISDVKFEINDKKFTDFEFIPLGINQAYNKDNTELFSTFSELLIISPFLSKCIFDELNSLKLKNADTTLITRKSELYKLSKQLLTDFNTYTLKDDIVDGEDRLSEQAEIKKQDIHAKVYLKTKYSDSELYIGSANASCNAFNGNIECMLKLCGKRRHLNVKSLKTDLFGDDEKSNPFDQVIPDDFEALDNDDIKNSLGQAIKYFCKSDVNAVVSGNFVVTVNVQKLSTDVSIYLTPLMTNDKQEIQDIMVFENLRLNQISEWYVITAKIGEDELSKVVKIKTVGIPENRDASIFSSIVSNEKGFLQYISFLLGDDYMLSFLEDSKIKDNGYKYLNLNYETPILYEKMLKAAATSKEKLREIKSVIEMIDDKKIIPDEFITLYEHFEKVVG